LRSDARGYLSNINIPSFTDVRYDLSRFLEVKNLVESSHSADEISYQPNIVLRLLKDFFNAEGEFMGVTYMPYYRCKYVGSDGRVRFDAVDNIKFKNG
jgi:hypothetical protein